MKVNLSGLEWTFEAWMLAFLLLIIVALLLSWRD